MNKPASSTDSSPTAVKSADRVLDLFELLSGWGQEMSHNDIAVALGIPKSSLTHLLKNLVARGYVSFSPISKGYRLGEAFAELARRAPSARTLLSIAAPLLQQMTARTRESSTLNQLKGDLSEVIATVSSPQRLVPHMRVGDVGPLYALSGGKAILAAMPDAMIDDYLARVTFERITPATIASKSQLRREIEQVRKDGVAYSMEEFTPGIAGVGVAILADGNFPLGSLTLAIPTVRFSPESRQLAIAVLQAAAAQIASHHLPQPKPAPNPESGPPPHRRR